ncbi:MAG TPA: HK97-gp10 family putative phage morphogenesis protein [Nocardioides sp.]|uniref:HK97-gp10 family putative phage morphogenesis protein n=1 Tax=Nocardioides sp. TaxID=35761 RepID=UPI002ED77369
MIGDVELRLKAKAEIDRLLNAPDGPIAAEMLRIGARIERDAKRACPVDTGRLRASITHKVERDDQGVSVRIGTGVTYAPWVELGTSRTPAQPFLRPALANEVGRRRG